VCVQLEGRMRKEWMKRPVTLFYEEEAAQWICNVQSMGSVELIYCPGMGYVTGTL